MSVSISSRSNETLAYPPPVPLVASRAAERLVIVANRLPVTAVKEAGKICLRQSSGGLVSGLDAYLDSLRRGNREYTWIGWPGLDAPDELKPALTARLVEEHNAHPIFISEEVMDKFYGGFCNKTVWPLFHYFPTYASFEDEYWETYRSVNEQYCEAVLRIARPDDVVWIHDYHLMLLPRLLRAARPDLAIGFFLHIPFPSFEVFRLLPSRWRTGILEGLLGADLIGFHTHDYTQYFLHCVLRILGHEHTLGRMVVDDRLVLADTFPMGIDYARYHDAAGDAGVVHEREALQRTFADQKVVISVDRLDYSKGILDRLRGFGKFLEVCPEWHKRVVLVLVLVPSRIGVDRYLQMKKRIDEYVGMLNGQYGTPGWTPICYQYHSLSFPQLVALYAAGDVALVTPLRDGMNLVAKEYIAARGDSGGVLILSEMAGASRELGEALIISPTDSDEIVVALKTALEMPMEEQVKRNLATQERLKRYNVVRWAEDFLDKLTGTRHEQSKFRARVMGSRVEDRVVSSYRAAQRRLLLLDYDGTLVPFAKQPEAALPGAELLAALERIGADPRTDLVVVSGRPRNVLDQWFAGLPLSLVAEHGAWIRRDPDAPWRLIKPLRADWKEGLLPILKLAADRLPGAFVEEKEFSLVWHYRRADPELASIREKELTDSLVQMTANMDVTVVQGHRIVEVRNAGVSKGNAALEVLSNEHDFVLAIGDDSTDEDMFRVLPESSYSIRVGLVGTHARFNVPGSRDVHRLVWRLAEASG
jgi:trehalose 6-phosphate synthase/phosphatase